MLHSPAVAPLESTFTLKHSQDLQCHHPRSLLMLFPLRGLYFFPHVLVTQILPNSLQPYGL